MPTPKLIALDWGSTSARAYLMSDESEIVGQRTAPLGVLNVKNGDFEGALLELCGPWLLVRKETPIVASGMIGSRQGWSEAPYVSCPAGLTELSSHLLPVDIARRRKLWIVPGVSLFADDGTPDVMRGEETQIVGALTAAEREKGSALFVLPGTHSKWVRVENGRIVWMRTYMTGELFSILSAHSILGKLMQKPKPGAMATEDDPGAETAFTRGVNRAHQDPFGLSSLLFSVRTLPLFEKLEPTQVADYLSGLLIGHEIYTAERALNALRMQYDGVKLVGEVALIRSYQRALTLLGWSSTVAPAFPAAAGIWRIADRSGLLGLSVEKMTLA